MQGYNTGIHENRIINYTNSTDTYTISDIHSQNNYAYIYTAQKLFEKHKNLQALSQSSQNDTSPQHHKPANRNKKKYQHTE